MTRFFIRKISTINQDRLCICDRNVNVGDLVRSIRHDDVRGFEESWNDVRVLSVQEWGIQVEGQYVDGFVGIGYAYKVVCEVPKDFRWQNDGDEFDEEELKMYNFGKRSFIRKIPPVDSYLSI